MAQTDIKNDKAQVHDHYRLPPELIAHLRAAMDAQEPEPTPEKK